jgi:glutathione-regulated potassium-efflux system ancillary protein KefG
MARTLVLFAHPALEKSRVHRRLTRDLPALVARTPGLTFRDLYETYPDFDVDVEAEQRLLESHDLVVLQHPFYWYSAPALVKQWFDLVLEHGWAYGSRGRALEGKRVLSVVTLGGSAGAYCRGGYNRFTVRELLAPIEQTARLCRMTYLPPYAVFGTHHLDDAGVAAEADRYARLLAAFAADRVAWPVDDVGPLECAPGGGAPGPAPGTRLLTAPDVDALLAAANDGAGAPAADGAGPALAAAGGAP